MIYSEVQLPKNHATVFPFNYILINAFERKIPRLRVEFLYQSLIIFHFVSGLIICWDHVRGCRCNGVAARNNAKNIATNIYLVIVLLKECCFELSFFTEAIVVISGDSRRETVLSRYHCCQAWNERWTQYVISTIGSSKKIMTSFIKVA